MSMFKFEFFVQKNLHHGLDPNIFFKFWTRFPFKKKRAALVISTSPRATTIKILEDLEIKKKKLKVSSNYNMDINERVGTANERT